MYWCKNYFTIKNSLRRPFRGTGAELSLGFRQEGSQTLSERHARFVVNEGAIMRWLGRLGASAFGDFSGRTELEENLFLYETFEALRRAGNRESGIGNRESGIENTVTNTHSP